ncbi:MAG: hypothetical protein J0L97_03710 [Alphaproteobacteria bacterium]|nr:hypothetical protein [Alphaproteobacteria bacterium]
MQALVAIAIFILGFLVYRAFVGQRPEEELVCTKCETIASPKKHEVGSPLAEMLFYLVAIIGGFFTGFLFLLLIPAIFYSISRQSKQKKVCSACGSAEIVPLHSPVGSRLTSTHG